MATKLLAQVEQLQPQIVLMDVNIPQMNGIETTVTDPQAVAERPGHRAIGSG